MINIILLIILLFPSIALADITTGLVGYWRLDEGSGTTANDSSGNSQTGTLTGGTWVINEGKLNNALRLNGTSNFIDITDGSNAYSFSNSTFSVSFWYRTNSSGGGTALSKGGSSTSGGGWAILVSGTVQLLTKNNAGASVLTLISNINGLNNYAWHHVVGVMTTDTAVTANNTGSIYIDGVLDTATPTKANTYVAPTGIHTFIGKRNGNTLFYPGVIDELRIYSRALTQADVTQLFQTEGVNVSYINNATLTNAIIR